jgi:hypothetical protein
MHVAHRSRAARSAGVRSARILLVLAALAGAFTLTVVGAEPAGAYTIERSPDEIVIRSDRLHENQTHVTVIVTLRSTGDWTLRVEAHCTASTRKFVQAWAEVWSPATNHTWPADQLSSGEKRRVDSGEWDEWQRTGWDAFLAARWDEVVDDPDLGADLRMRAYRLA